MNKESGNSFWKGLGVTVVVSVVTTIVTTLVTKALHIISPEESKVVITDTLNVVQAQASGYSDDSLLYVAISELNKTIRESLPQSNSNKIVCPESTTANVSTERQDPPQEILPSTNNSKGLGSVGASSPINVNVENPTYVNRIIDKKGFYKKGYSISDGGSFYVLKKIPKVEEDPLTFEIRLLQPADLLSHIYLNICTTNEKGELYQFFGQTYDIRDGLNRIRIANNLREGKNRVEIGVFMKSDEGKDFPTFYRNIFTLVK